MRALIQNRPVALLLFSILLMAAALPAAAQTAQSATKSAAAAAGSYTNPVLTRPPKPHAELADPYILKWNGEYYLYTSGDPIYVYRSEDLVRWEFVGPVMSSSRAPGAWNQAEVWAPEVVYRNGKFLLYYTATLKSEDWRVSEMGRRVGVGVSDSPAGPFVDAGRAVTAGWAIDGTVFRDPETAEEFLFYSYLYEPKLPGAGIVADRLVTAERAAGDPAHVTRGSEAWEDKDGDPANGSLRYTNEAPVVMKRNGTYYMIYSGGSWDLPTYALGYATAKRLPGGGLDGEGWKKAVAPILRATPLVDAPGHNAVTKAPNNVDDINVFHARVVPFVEPWNRMPFVDRMFWNHDRIFMPTPSLGRMAAPDRPVFGDNFNRADGAVGARWEAKGGAWQVSGRQLRQQSATGEAVAMAKTEPLVDFVAEANVRSAAGAAGVRLQLAGDDGLTITLDPLGRIVVDGRIGGKAVAPMMAKVKPPLEMKAYHQLLVTRNADRVRVDVDGVKAFEGEFAMGGAGARIGLVTRGTGAEFDGVAITPFFEDNFESAAGGWAHTGGAWLTEQGAMHQVAAGGLAVSLKGTPAESYELTASVQLRDNDSLQSKVGVVAAASGDTMVLAGFDRNIWPFARFWVMRVVGGKVQERLQMPMPRGFRYDEFHTLRAVKHKDAFTFYMDGMEIATARFALGAAQAGVFTDGARAAFDDVRIKRQVVAPNLLLDGSFESEQWQDNSRPVEGNAWTVSGEARANYCCAHTGLRRLMIRGKGGEARQSVKGLAAGKYVLYGFATASAPVELTVLAGGERRQVKVSERWTEFAVPFTVAAAEKGETVVGVISGAVGDGLVAVDDLFLAAAETED